MCGSECVYVCVRERERVRETHRRRERKCMCVSACVCVIACVACVCVCVCMCVHVHFLHWCDKYSSYVWHDSFTLITRAMHMFDTAHNTFTICRGHPLDTDQKKGRLLACVQCVWETVCAFFAFASPCMWLILPAGEKEHVFTAGYAVQYTSVFFFVYACLQVPNVFMCVYASVHEAYCACVREWSVRLFLLILLTCKGPKMRQPCWLCLQE